ncbi:MAG: single-stranded DNA-binding protein [Anaerolineaceae bacterium]|nr:AAA family ATPase [Anaerolineae bacterium]MDL1926288.1 AAA family ATPase [Anaerolineae bacterium AMX1]WKZ54963.1 MAG: R3H domain-containing nucleic acid-binding protein [Anaerolineales bacterium]GIK09333.1 MAG: single-stranded DNA-binding protein [Chloroflexota bacterium]GJQ39310.1 MAG: single-stranded DNA-binding protein [Anaerolineaceae bacterium]
MDQKRITDDLDALLEIIPPSIRHAVEKANDSENLLEIILDLGRVPTARFVDREIILREAEVTRAEIDYVDERVGEFDADNRAGLERTLHRLSAIRNRRDAVVGLTLRVGRAVYGTIDIIEDIVNSGKSLLILGRPGVGKTTLLREAARILAETKRVVIVDTSNEIGGDGDVPHPAVGKARRMQVKAPTLQHEVMIEAVENHNPEVIVIDEIGRELETLAARTIAERGVQLIGTAHGNTLDNLLLNPTLSDLVGGIEAVTLSDEEARRRGTQKTVLERRAPPTFDVLVEIQTRDRFAVHTDIMASVDALLRGFPLPPEIRTRDPEGQIKIEKAAPAPGFRLDAKEPTKPTPRRPGKMSGSSTGRQPAAAVEETRPASRVDSAPAAPASALAMKTVRVYPYGVARNRLQQAAKRFGVPAVIVRDVDEADALVTLRAYYRDRQATIMDAEARGMPIYVLRANTVAQVDQFMSDLFNLPSEGVTTRSSELDNVRDQTQAAIAAVLNGERWVDLPPGPSLVRRLQHEMARSAELVSHSYGKEPRRHVRIFRE